MNDDELERQLQQRLTQLSPDIMPQRDLWAGIDHAIEQGSASQAPPPVVRPKGVAWQKLTGIAASFAVLGLTLLLTMDRWSNPSTSDSYFNGAPYLVELQASHRQQKQLLLAKYADTTPVTDNWREQLKQLDDAAKAVMIVLAEDPANPQLLNMLRQIYQQQIDLINTVNHGPWQKI